MRGATGLRRGQRRRVDHLETGPGCFDDAGGDGLERPPALPIQIRGMEDVAKKAVPLQARPLDVTRPEKIGEQTPLPARGNLREDFRRPVTKMDRQPPMQITVEGSLPVTLPADPRES